MEITRRVGLAAALALGLSALGFGPARAAEPLKVGFIYVGPIGDHGYSYQHNEGRLAVEKYFGDKVKTTYVENVPEGPDSERVIRQLAQTGHQLIFTTSFGYMNPTAKAARQFPKTKFEHATGYMHAPNLATYTARFYEARYVIGVAAGRVTKSNKLGYIASFPIPEVVRNVNAFILGARSVNPKAEVQVVWANSWYDPGKEREVAEALIAQGVDVITQHTDSAAPIQAADEKGIWAVGHSSDMSRFGPRSHLTALVNDWSAYYISRVQAVLDGTWKSANTWDGFDKNMVRLAPFNPATPSAVKAEALMIENAIKAKTVHPFTGPIYDQKGKERVPAGTIMSDDALLKMNWFVQGVVGDVPK
ncbi:MAG: BMP family ABC transporter substrate-binding protein [Rhodospirillaceae bacterium]|nr:BMP family ABC transporter substrate-binding protein [Rhodospirillaceae bacterium]